MASAGVIPAWSQRKRFVMRAVSLNAIIGLTLILIGLFVLFSTRELLPRAHSSTLVQWIFSSIAFYGLFVHLYSLLGIHLLRNYYAKSFRMNIKLFAWIIIGFFMVCIGFFMASLCSTTAIHLPKQIRRSLLEGMKCYLTEIAWKRALDHMQTRMHCCGIDSYDDWYKTYWIQRELLNLDSPNILE